MQKKKDSSSSPSSSDYDALHESCTEETNSFSLDKEKIPKCVAIIMDGNRRWAKQKKKLPFFGHVRGAKALMETVKNAIEIGIEELIVYAFSTENKKRSSKEVQLLMDLFEKYLKKMKSKMERNGVQLHGIGDIDALPKGVKEAFYMAKKATCHGKKIKLVLALNYGARDEIRRAVEKILFEDRKKNFKKEEIKEELVSKHLDTASLKDPDLLIRTSGEMRLSNFLLYQLSYSEVYVTDVLWPDFGKKDLIDAIQEYQKRDRRRGK